MKAADTRIEELRREFDQAFALPPAELAARPVNILAIRLAGNPYGLRLAELSGLQLRRKIVPLPGRGGEFLGIAGVRGKAVPVYGLARLLGLTEDTEQDRWLAIRGVEEPVAVAFAEFTAHHTVDPSELRPAEGAGAQGAIPEVVVLGGVPHPVIRLATVLEKIQGAASGGV